MNKDSGAKAPTVSENPTTGHRLREIFGGIAAPFIVSGFILAALFSENARNTLRAAGSEHGITVDSSTLEHTP